MPNKQTMMLIAAGLAAYLYFNKSKAATGASTANAITQPTANNAPKDVLSNVAQAAPAIDLSALIGPTPPNY